MRGVIRWLNESAYLAPLSPACEMCSYGSKLVLLVTGLCPAKCYYCPISFEKGGKDRIFADEWEFDDEEDTEKLICEAEYIDATGAGVTGGDPLVVWRRVKDYILLLKEVFGDGFHIHLYTSGLKNGDHIDDLVSAGLDEVRFHPAPKYWAGMDKSPVCNIVRNVLETSVDVAFEIPSIPGMEAEMFSLVKWAEDSGIRWVNLNELEYSERNADNLSLRSYTVTDDVSAAVKGSQESAYKVLDMVAREDLEVGVHYCSCSFKDGIQLRNRIKRRANNVAREYEVISDEGTLLKGVIYSQNMSPKKLYELLKQEFNIADNHIRLDKEKNRVETGVWILEKISPILRKRGIQCYMVEEYPTADGLEVERIPLPL